LYAIINVVLQQKLGINYKKTTKSERLQKNKAVVYTNNFTAYIVHMIYAISIGKKYSNMLTL